MNNALRNKTKKEIKRDWYSFIIKHFIVCDFIESLFVILIIQICKHDGNVSHNLTLMATD